MTFLENTRKEYHKIKESPNRARERERISTLIPRAELLVVVEEGSSGQSSSLALRENLSRGDTNEKNMNQSAVCLFFFPMPDPPSNRLDPPLMFCHCLFPSSVQVVSSTKLWTTPLYMEGFLQNSILVCTIDHPALLATSAALCLIISITAALRRESDCCCSLLKCSFRSLKLKNHRIGRYENELGKEQKLAGQ